MINSHRRQQLLIIILIAGAALAVMQATGWLQPAIKVARRHQPGWFEVHRFIDGDTIEVNMNGAIEKVRFIGVDTPEKHKPHTPIQCYGPAAAAYTKATIGASSVRLVSDPLSTDRDRYNRLLRYVYLPDGSLLNERIVESGYGFYYPYFPFSEAEQFDSAERQAQHAHRGLWGNCQPTPTDGGGWLSSPL